MVLELARSAIYIKMAAKVEAPIISTFEYCFASGLACKKMGISEVQKNQIRDLDDFVEMKKRMEELVEASDVWSTFEHGERLKSMLTNCRIRNAMDPQARELFDIGYQEK